MNTWTYEPIADLGGGLELTMTTPDEEHVPRLHLGRWTQTKSHIKWTGWIDRRQLHRLFVFLRDHPEYRDDTEPEDVYPADPFTT